MFVASYKHKQFVSVALALVSGRAYGIESSSQLSEIKRLAVLGYLSYTAQRIFLTGPISGGFTVKDVEPGQRSPAAFDQIHTGVAGLTYRERRSGFFATTQLEYGSGTPAALHVAEGDVALVRLPDHFVANFHFAIDLPFKEGVIQQ
jgi:hypothetical protein